MTEYDFRFPGIDPLRDPAKIRRLRDCLLELAGGFTEIREGVLPGLLRGSGTGYIVSLPDESSRLALQALLAHLAEEWGSAAPALERAADGPRKNFGFFLIPELANPAEHGYRRALFSRARWEGIYRALAGKLSHPVVRAYGEWKPAESKRVPDKDVSFLFVFRCASEADAGFFERFIREQVFDGGRECDQETIYMSARGESRFIDAPTFGA